MKKRSLALLILFFSIFPKSAFPGMQVLFSPKISASQEYSDNVFLSEESPAQDTITVLSPGFRLQLAEKTWNTKLSYDFGYSEYEKNPENNTLRHNSLLTGWYGFFRNTRLDFHNTFIYTEESNIEQTGYNEDSKEVPEETQDRISEIDTTMRKERKPWYSDTARAGFTHHFGKSDAFNISYIQHILENEDPEIKDRRTYNPSARMNYWVIPNTFSIRSGIYWKESEYLSLQEDTWDKSIGSAVGVSYWIIPAHLAADFDISYIRIAFSDPADDFDNLHGKIKLTKQITQHLKGFVQYAHTIMDSKTENNSYQIYDLSSGIDYLAAGSFPVSLSIGYFIRDRKTETSESAVSIKGDIGKAWKFKHASIHLTGSNGYDESYLGTEALGFDLYQDIKCTAKYDFSKNSNANFFVSYRRDKYTDPESERRDRTAKSGFNLNFRLTDWISIKFEYLFCRRDSTLKEKEYEENRFIAMISSSLARPIKIQP